MDCIDFIFTYVLPIVGLVIPFIQSYQKRDEALSKCIIVIQEYQAPGFFPLK